MSYASDVAKKNRDQTVYSNLIIQEQAFNDGLIGRISSGLGGKSSSSIIAAKVVGPTITPVSLQTRVLTLNKRVTITTSPEIAPIVEALITFLQSSGIITGFTGTPIGVVTIPSTVDGTTITLVFQVVYF